MELLAGLLSLVCVIVFFVMASSLSKIASSTRNTEAILKRLLEIEKERDNNGKAGEQVASNRADEFSKYKAKI